MLFIRQRSFFNSTGFTFKNDKLKFTINDSKGSQTSSTNYSSIQLENISEVTEKNDWFRNAGIFCLMVEAVKTLSWFYQYNQIKSSIWLVIGILSIAVYSLVKTKYSILTSDSGSIFIIKNKNHDRILDEIRKRRKKQILRLYGDINYENNPKDEITKFAWLKELGLISEEKLNSAVRKINDYHSNKFDDPLEDNEGGKTLN